MRFGVNIINFGPHATPQSLRDWAHRAEDSGFHLAMISDHVTVTSDVAEHYPAPFYDAFTALAWLSGLTSEIELGTTVTVLPYRHPLQVARVTANIDQFSAGRFILGVGAGWSRQEYDALGVPFHRRGALTDEYLKTITQLWTHDVTTIGDSVIHSGPRPARTPHPPIWVGGSSPAAIRRAAQYGDGWHPIRPRLDWLRGEGLATLRQEAQNAGRPVPALCPRIPVRLDTLDQIVRDIDGLHELGAEYVVFDTYVDQEHRDLDYHWQVLRHVSRIMR